MSGVLRRFYALIDGPDAAQYVQLLAEDLRFSILFSTGPDAATDFAGGRAEFDAYMAQRGTPAWTHHVVAESTDGPVETVLGQTRQDGRPVATFVAAVRIDADGRIDRYIVGRSPAVMFDD
jgi:ketosteroid isomerase-like protein